MCLKKILPEVGSSKRITVRPKVVFPHPDSPTIPRVSPSNIWSDTLLSALIYRLRKRLFNVLAAGNHLLRFSVWRMHFCWVVITFSLSCWYFGHDTYMFNFTWYEFLSMILLNLIFWFLAKLMSLYWLLFACHKPVYNLL